MLYFSLLCGQLTSIKSFHFCEMILWHALGMIFSYWKVIHTHGGSLTHELTLHPIIVGLPLEPEFIGMIFLVFRRLNEKDHMILRTDIDLLVCLFCQLHVSLLGLMNIN